MSSNIQATKQSQTTAVQKKSKTRVKTIRLFQPSTRKNSCSRYIGIAQESKARLRKHPHCTIRPHEPSSSSASVQRRSAIEQRTHIQSIKTKLTNQKTKSIIHHANPTQHIKKNTKRNKASVVIKSFKPISPHQPTSSRNTTKQTKNQNKKST